MGTHSYADGGAILHAEPNPLILYHVIAMPPQFSAEDQINSTLHCYREINRLGMTGAIDAGGGGHAFPKDYSGSQAVTRDGQMSVKIGYYFVRPERGKGSRGLSLLDH